MERKANIPDITVFRGWLDKGKYVWSPFVTKLEARLRFAGVPYTGAAGSPRSAPKGKIPYIECRWPAAAGDVPGGDASPTTLSDSALIAKEFVARDVLPDLNARLSPEAKAQDLGLRALLEDKLCFYLRYERYVQNYYTMRDHILWSMSYPMRVLVGLLAYRATISALYGQGTGRHTPEEIAAFRAEIWETVSGLLAASKAKATSSAASKGSGSGDAGDEAARPFWALGGDQPTEADSTLYGFIVSVLICTAGPDSKKVVTGHPILLEYASRIHDLYFPDYEKWETA